MDFIRKLGLLAIGSRLRRLSDRMMAEGVAIYRAAGVEFEPRWFPLYRFVLEAGPVSVGEAARALGVSHASISQKASAMKRQGVLEVLTDPSDERRRLLSVTPDGRSLATTLNSLWDDLESAVGEVADDLGVNILTALEGFERALDEENLAQRTSRHHKQRLLDAVEIVDYDPRYKEDFKALNVEWLQKYFEVEPVDQQMLDDPDGQILAPGGRILFALVEGEVLGTCALQRDGDRYELIKMAVTEGAQGRQIGKALMERAIEVARRDGVPSVFLVTNSSLTPALNLYRRSGFKITHRGPHPKYERGDLMMELMLQDQPDSVLT